MVKRHRLATSPTTVVMRALARLDILRPVAVSLSRESTRSRARAPRWATTIAATTVTTAATGWTTSSVVRWLDRPTTTPGGTGGVNPGDPGMADILSGDAAVVITTLPTRSRRRLHRGIFNVDLTLVITTMVVAALGVVMVYTATRGSLLAQGISPHYFLDRQAIWVVIGAVAMTAVGFLDYRHLEAFAWIIYGLLLFSLLVVLSPIGKHTLGSQRWFSIAGQQLQPSEFAVLGMILAVATYCARRSSGLTWGDVGKVLLMAGVPILLVMKQPDLGTAIVMLVVLFVMLAVAGLPGRILVVLLIAGVLAVILALAGGVLHHYQLTRLTTFLHQDSSRNPAATYNLQQSKDAIGSGGLFGTGLLKGTQTNLGYVPEQQTDFIFTAVGEQLGFVGGSIILFLLGLLSWRVLRSSQVARDPFGRLLCAGTFAFIAFSVFQNVGMTMGIMPITGIPLPFMSYGGSAVLCFFLAVGLSLSVYARRNG
jgi:rod shape determining protein RodA